VAGTRKSGCWKSCRSVNGVAMNAVNRYLVNTAQAKGGLGTEVLIGYATQAALSITTAILFLIALFLVFSDAKKANVKEKLDRP
jgi:hypothetical protein